MCVFDVVTFVGKFASYGSLNIQGETKVFVSIINQVKIVREGDLNKTAFHFYLTKTKFIRR